MKSCLFSVMGKIEITKLSFFDDKSFLVKFQSPVGGVREIFLDSLLPFEAAEETNVLNFARKYDLPFTGKDKIPFTVDGRRVIDYYPLAVLKMWLANIKFAVTLWRLIGEKDIKGITSILKADKIYEPYATGDNILSSAKSMLAACVTDGMVEFPTTDQLSFEKEKYINRINPRSAMGFIWSIFRDDLVSGREWHYKQCKYCGAWEDMQKPGLRRSIWTHCNKEDCRRAHEKEKSRKRSAVYRKRQIL